MNDFDNQNKNLRPKYEVTRTVRFGLQNFDDEKGNESQTKNAKYNSLVEKVGYNTPEILNLINNTVKRSLWNCSENDWNEFVDKLNEINTESKKLADNSYSMKTSLSKIDDKYMYQIVINLKNLSSIDLFWKRLKIQCNKTKVDLKELSETRTIDNYLHCFNIDISQSKNVNKLIEVYLKVLIDSIRENSREINNAIKKQNYVKSRLNIIHSLVRIQIIQLNKLHLFVTSLEKKGNLSGDILKIFESIDNFSKKLDDNIKSLKDIEQSLHNPNNGFEIGKATLHYRTINKKSNFFEDEIKSAKKVLGEDIYENNLAKKANLIVKSIIKKESEINNQYNIIDKAKKLLSIIDLGESANLYQIRNAIDYKHISYDKFMESQMILDDVGLKQQIRFALLALVDCDVYDTRFRSNALKLKESAIEIVKDFKFHYEDYYTGKSPKKLNLGYKSFTEKIKQKNDPINNAKKRGNLFAKSQKYSETLKAYSIVTSIIGNLEVYKSTMESEKENLAKISYFAVLGKVNDSDIVLFANKNTAKDLHQYLYHLEDTEGDNYLMQYNSLTWKSLEKLFNQKYGKNHPFFSIKSKIFESKLPELESLFKEEKDKIKKAQIEKKLLERIDAIKLKDLNLEEIKSVLKDTNEKDIVYKELWTKQFSEFYSNLEKVQSIEELINLLNTKCISFVPKAFNPSDLRKKIPSILIANYRKGINLPKRDLIHWEYFDKAMKTMKNGGEVRTKLNPEISMFYNSEADDKTKEMEKARVNEKNKTLPAEKQIKFQTLENSHRFWRNQIIASVGVEFVEPLSKQSDETEKFRMIGIDRGEKKLATICHVECDRNYNSSKFSDQNFRLLPIEYYENGIKNYSYFLDAENFQIGKINGQTTIIKLSEQKNLELDKYQFKLRLKKNLWLRENQNKWEEFFSTNNESDWVKKLDKLEWFDITGLKEKFNDFIKHANYVNDVLEIIKNYKIGLTFMPKEQDKIEEWYHLKREVEVEKINLRSNISANISGIINYLYSSNKDISTYVSMENLYNSSWFSKHTQDPSVDTTIATDSFMDNRHERLSTATVYGKIQWAILNKLQLQRNNVQIFINRTHDCSYENYKQKITSKLKYIAKSGGKRKTADFYGIETNIHETLPIGTVYFVDPSYTSNKCPKCGKIGKKGSGVSRSNGKLDEVKCDNCRYSTKDSNNCSGMLLDRNYYEYIRSGDENGAFQIAMRGCLSKCNDLLHKDR